jgi:hypothetical protein
MPIMFRRFIVAAIVAATGLLISPSSADAGFQVTLYAPGGPVGGYTVADGGGDDIAGASNVIAVNGLLVGGYTFNFTFAATNTSGTPTLSFVGSSGIADGTGAGTIQIVASANGFTQPVSPPDLVAISNATFQAQPENTGSFSVSLTSALDTGNALSTTAVGTVIGSDTDSISSTGVVALTDVQNIGSVTTTPYALNFALTATTSNTGRNVIDLDGGLQIRPVPAPAGLILAATALPFVGILRRRLRRPEAATAA